MPEQLVNDKRPFPLSIVKFDPDNDEEIFLTYVWGREFGPEIIREGIGPPTMELIGGAPGEKTTNPYGQRLGTWLIQEDLRNEELNNMQNALKRARDAKKEAEEKLQSALCY